MNGYRVDPTVLDAHSSGTQAQAENFTSLARLLEQGTVSDDCFGPALFWVRDMYNDSLVECRDLATRASGFLGVVAETVGDTAKEYVGAEDSATAGMTEASKDLAGTDIGTGTGTGTGPGTLDDVNSAGDPKGYLEQTANWGSSAYNTSAAFAEATNPRDPGSPPQVFFATVNARMEMLSTIVSPGKALFDNGFGFLVSFFLSPVIQLVVEPLVGDPEQMRSTAKGWSDVAKWVEGAGERERQRADATKSGWQGKAADAFRGEMTEFAAGADALAVDINDVKSILETTADIFDTFVLTVVDMVQEWVVGLLVEWIAATAAAWFTGGGSYAAAETSTVTRTGRLAQRLITEDQKLKKLLNGKLSELEALLVRLRSSKLGNLVTSKLRKMHDVPVVGKMIKSNPLTGTLSGVKNMDNLASHAGETLVSGAATGTEALARRAAKLGLGMVGLSGHANAKGAAIAGAVENVPGAVVQWTAGQVYDETTNPSEEERKQAEDKGFTVEDE